MISAGVTTVIFMYSSMASGRANSGSSPSLDGGTEEDLWTVVYSDGDKEDLSQDEVLEAILVAQLAQDAGDHVDIKHGNQWFAGRVDRLEEDGREFCP